jgi:predicted nucleotidyltransferase
MLQNCSVWRVAAVFFRSPTTEFTLKDVSTGVKLAHTSVKAHLRQLLKEGLIRQRRERKGRRLFPLYRAEQEGATYRYYKRLYNLISVRDLVEYLADELMPECIVLFGSYARGEDTEDSDIDLYLQCDTAQPDLSRHEKRLHRRIQIHFTKDFQSLPKEMRNNIGNGFILHGYLRFSA